MSLLIMDTSMYTWQHLLFTADILVQKSCLNENQLEMIIDMVDYNQRLEI
jgi:hypothetical protein